MLQSSTVRVLIPICLVCVAQLSAQDTAQFASELSTLTPQIESVASGGHWKRDAAEGMFRLIVRIVGYEHIRNQVFLQWIRESDDPEHPNVVERTITIPELLGWRITGQRFALDRTQWKIVVAAQHEDMISDTPKTQKKFFTLTPTADYTYKVSESNARPSI